ncbi:phosphopantetheine attachment site family protein [Xanthomonas citri pv. mangiferaeindicae LMG 941]|uniref:alpha/beta fold hydrolase n=1 Tax=Xanthomonas citri TaxID=346 RepID=UPI0002552141|nr:phosphopantetheine attachment site family protein [Xanthomonas citri pv. mangiferaeindicae LMG 941]
MPLPARNDHAGHDDTPPQGELETLLHTLWSQLLRIDRIGRHDDFLALGGHSLLLVRLNGLLKRAGTAVPLSVLSAHTSLAAMATAIERWRETSTPPGVVTVRMGGDKRPLFLVHDFSGLDLYFAPLGEHLAPDVPVYGLSAVALGAPQPRTVQELAARLLRHLRMVQPHGPYRVAGWSFGGLLAYEIATQLLAVDELVEFVGLIDTYHPSQLDLGPAYIDPAHAPQRLLLQRCLVALPDGEQRASAQANLQALAAQVGQWEDTALIRLCRSRGWLPSAWADQDDASLPQSLAREFAHGYAQRHYLPMAIHMPVHLFAAAQALAPRSASDAALAWQALLGADMLTCITVPGDHHTMLQTPHVAALGAAISQQLEASQQSLPRGPQLHVPLTRIQTGALQQPVVVCVPGAAENVAGFVDLAAALGDAWSVYGLQPRGLQRDQLPHGTVESAATAYVAWMLKELPGHPIHLLGHSFGGWVAFDLARQLAAHGRTVASLTLLDAEAPGGDGAVGKPYTATAVLERLIESLQLSRGTRLGIDPLLFPTLDHAQQLELVRAGMVRAVTASCAGRCHPWRGAGLWDRTSHGLPPCLPLPGQPAPGAGRPSVAGCGGQPYPAREAGCRMAGAGKRIAHLACERRSLQHVARSACASACALVESIGSFKRVRRTAHGVLRLARLAANSDGNVTALLRGARHAQGWASAVLASAFWRLAEQRYRVDRPRHAGARGGRQPWGALPARSVFLRRRSHQTR